MCCRACPGYQLCRTKEPASKGKAPEEECCNRCPYFDSCIEIPLIDNPKTRVTNRPNRRRG